MSWSAAENRSIPYVALSLLRYTREELYLKNTQNPDTVYTGQDFFNEFSRLCFIEKSFCD